MSIATTPVWDLTDLYQGIDDPNIDETLDRQLKRADAFASKYRGQIDTPDLKPETLREAIEELESIMQEADKPLNYASLLFSADTSDPDRGAFLQRMRERRSEIAIQVIFFELELMAIPEEEIDSLLQGPGLDKYRHFINAERLFREYRLTEPEEKILEEKSNSGRRAFRRLFEEVLSGIPFKITKDGAEETVTLQEVVALFRDPSRDVRRMAADSLTEGLEANRRSLTFIYNTLLQDKATDDRLRSYLYPEHDRHLSNELDRATVELVVQTAVSGYPLMARYYRIKRTILGYDKLTHYDRYAPIFTPKEEIPFDRAREIVVGSFSGFSPIIGDVAAQFFSQGWIDAEVRKGKQGGAFCSYITPDLHPYVLVNYLNRMDDVMTLGHELGHAVHAYLGRDQSYLNFNPVLPVAELASTFGEMLVFEALQEQADIEDRLALHAEKIEGSLATIFRQAAMFRFEQMVHGLRREKGELTSDEIGEVWQQRQQETFGDSLELGEQHKLWWIYVPHFYRTPFYVYAYTFGELLVMSLYAMYREEGEAFPPRYIELLKTGGSLSPAEMLSRIGVDIHSPEFWQGGMQVLNSLVDRFEALYMEYAG